MSSSSSSHLLTVFSPAILRLVCAPSPLFPLFPAFGFCVFRFSLFGSLCFESLRLVDLACYRFCLLFACFLLSLKRASRRSLISAFNKQKERTYICSLIYKIVKLLDHLMCVKHAQFWYAFSGLTLEACEVALYRMIGINKSKL